MDKLLVYGECRICGTPCIWIPMVDGVIADLEVCSLECLEKVTEELKEDGAEMEGKQ